MDRFEALYISLKIRLQKRGRNVEIIAKRLRLRPEQSSQSSCQVRLLHGSLKISKPAGVSFHARQSRKLQGVNSIRRCELNYALRLFGTFSAVGIKPQIKSFLRCIEITMTFRQYLSNGISLNNNVRIVSQTIESFSIMFP